MKIPAWLVSVIGTIIAAATIGAFAWAWNVNAKVSSHDVRIEVGNTNLIDYRSDTKADIQEVKELIINANQDNRDEHERIYKILERIRNR